MGTGKEVVGVGGEEAAASAGLPIGLGEQRGTGTGYFFHYLGLWERLDSSRIV
jgi:hypothetical protein